MTTGHGNLLIITAVAAQKLENKLQTFSVGFDIAEFDETLIAQEIAQRYRTEHHRIQLSEEEVIQAIRMLTHFGQVAQDPNASQEQLTTELSRAPESTKLNLTGLLGLKVSGGVWVVSELSWTLRLDQGWILGSTGWTLGGTPGRTGLD